MQLIPAILFWVLGVAFIAVLWDSARRYTNLKLRLADAIASYQKSTEQFRAELAKETSDLSATMTSVSSLQLSRDAASADLKTHELRFEEVRELIRGLQDLSGNLGAKYVYLCAEIDKLKARGDDPELAKTLEYLKDRCEKNTKALENTAENLQKVLHEKLTAIALGRGVNQRTG